jgi:hypothetical protein
MWDCPPHWSICHLAPPALASRDAAGKMITIGCFFLGGWQTRKVIALQGFAEALCSRITDPTVKRTASRRLIGGIDMISDHTDILSDPRWRPVLRGLFT